MALRQTRLARKKIRKGQKRIRTTLTVWEETEIALELYAQDMPPVRGRSNNASAANEQILLLSRSLKRYLPEAKKILKQRRVYEAEHDELLDDIVRSIEQEN